MNYRTLATALSLVALASLTACGGGGGGGSTSSATTAGAGNGTSAPSGSGSTGGATGGSTGGGSVVTLAVPVTGTLQTAVPASTYVSGSVTADAFAMLNAIRVQAGAGLLVQSDKLDTSAAAHSMYEVANPGLGQSHNEVAGATGFYEVSPAARVAKAGFDASTVSETLGGTGVSGKGADYSIGMMNSVYHAAVLLGNSTHAGFGAALDFGGYPVVTTDLATLRTDAYGQVPAAGALVTYPTAGQVGVQESFDATSESPRPPVADTVGTPVLVSVGNADYVNNGAAGTLAVTVTTFTLKDAAGNLVPATILAAPEIHGGAGVTVKADANKLSTGFAALVPSSPLVKGQTYTVSFAATLSAGGTPVSKTWSFTTAQ